MKTILFAWQHARMLGTPIPKFPQAFALTGSSRWLPLVFVGPPAVVVTMMRWMAIIMLTKASTSAGAEPCVGCTAGAGFVQHKRYLSQTRRDDFCEGKKGLHEAPAGAEGNIDCRGRPLGQWQPFYLFCPEKGFPSK